MTHSREEILNRNEDLNCPKVRLSHPSLVIQGILNVFIKYVIFLVECKIWCSLPKKIRFYPQTKTCLSKFLRHSLEEGDPHQILLSKYLKCTASRCCVFRHFQEVTSKRPVTRALVLITKQTLGVTMKLIQQNGWI